MVSRLVYYLWVITVFPLTYALLPWWEEILSQPLLIISLIIVNAIILGWAGDKIIFTNNKGKYRPKAAKATLIIFVVLFPLVSMATDMT